MTFSGDVDDKYPKLLLRFLFVAKLFLISWGYSYFRRLIFVATNSPQKWHRYRQKTCGVALSLLLYICELSGTGDLQRDSRESIRENHSQLRPLFL